MGQDPFRMLPAVEEALILAEIGPRGAGAAQLARRYAQLMDAATPAGKYRAALRYLDKLVDHFQDTIRMTPTEERGLETAVDTIKTALGEHSVASDFGPKLLAVLERLNMAVPAPSVPQPGEAPASEQPKPPSARDELKAKRVARERGAQAVHATAP